ncbi:S-layer homology domain-containing protein [Bacillus sp. CGMCC 1.16541]|uniref:S-layer homology domain-containing protein n=1 Tax=Bacillus sp. CGMCC 1.16541 TaxID=2185143 RepID=UPI0013A59151|nr:S-layer homology domain-containing protein [Bacillus sp. CGMCC 1.16541]
MARMITTAFDLKGESKITFKDVPKQYWAYPYITKIAANNITTGYSDQTFRPKNKVSRAQFSVFLSRSLNNDFKTYTYTSSKLNVNMTLPNYMKNKLIIKEHTHEDTYGVKADIVSFYYNDTSVAKQPVWISGVSRVRSQYVEPFFGPDAVVIAKGSSYTYVMQTPGEHPYMYFENTSYPKTKEAHEYIRFYNRLSTSIPTWSYR